MSRLMHALTVSCLAWQLCGMAAAAPFDVYYRPGASAPWTFYGGRGSRESADATAIDLKQLGGYETKIVAGNAVAPAVSTRVAAAAVPTTRAIGIGSTPYVSRTGQGYVPGWYRPWGGWTGGAWGGGWEGGYGGYAGSSTHHHSSSHHHHHSHESHHAGHAGTNHPAHAGGRAGGVGHRSAAHHSHSHSHSHSHHSHAGHHGHGGHHR